MKHACLKVGQHLILDDQSLEIIRINEDNFYQLERKLDFKLINRTRAEILTALESGSLKFTCSKEGNTRNNIQSRDLESFSKAQQETAKRRMDYVRNGQKLGDKPAFLGLDRIIEETSRELKDPEPPSPHTLFRWWKRWLDSGRDITSLIPRKRKSGHVATRFPKAILTLLSEIIYEDYLRREAFSKQDVYDRLKFEVQRLNKTTSKTIKAPGRSTVYRFIDKLDQHDLVLAKKGKRFAEKQFRESGQGVLVKNILERVEFDHTPLDLIVIDEKTNLPVGRPNLTCLIDKASRSILGYSLSFEPPSELSVIRALRQALFSKYTLKEQLTDLTNEWIAYGVPMVLVVDNGMEFHSKMLRQLCYELNIELVFCPKQEPQLKGCIERTLGTLNREVSHHCAGTTFGNISERGDYESAKLARVTLAEANDLITRWIVDVYHQRRHTTTRYTPDYLWKEGLTKIEPRLPESTSAFDLASARPYMERRLAHDGIRFLYLNYNSSDLQPIRRSPLFSGKVNIRVNHEDLGFIWVHDQANDEYIKVPCTHIEYAGGLSLLQHQKILEEKKLDSDTQYDEEKYLAGKEKLRQKINDLNTDRLLRERKRGARIAMKAIKQASETGDEPDSPTVPAKTGFSDLGDIPQFETHQIGGR